MNELRSDAEFYRLLEKYDELEEKINKRIEAIREILGYEEDEENDGGNNEWHWKGCRLLLLYNAGILQLVNKRKGERKCINI